MDALRSYLLSLDPESQAAFCTRCGTTLGYVKKVIWLAGKKRFGGKLCIAFERESKGAVNCEALRPDIDWGYLRGKGKARAYRLRKSESVASS